MYFGQYMRFSSTERDVLTLAYDETYINEKEHNYNGSYIKFLSVKRNILSFANT